MVKLRTAVEISGLPARTELGTLPAGRWRQPTAAPAGRETSLDTALRLDGRPESAPQAQASSLPRADLSGTVRPPPGELVDVTIAPQVPRQQRSLFLKLDVLTNLDPMLSLKLVRGDHHEVIHIEADDGHVGMNEHAGPVRDLSPAQLGQD